jgi:hypothetical protein
MELKPSFCAEACFETCVSTFSTRSGGGGGGSGGMASLIYLFISFSWCTA